MEIDALEDGYSGHNPRRSIHAPRETRSGIVICCRAARSRIPAAAGVSSQSPARSPPPGTNSLRCCAMDSFYELGLHYPEFRRDRRGAAVGELRLPHQQCDARCRGPVCSRMEPSGGNHVPHRPAAAGHRGPRGGCPAGSAAGSIASARQRRDGSGGADGMGRLGMHVGSPHRSCGDGACASCTASVETMSGKNLAQAFPALVTAARANTAWSRSRSVLTLAVEGV